MKIPLRDFTKFRTIEGDKIEIISGYNSFHGYSKGTIVTVTLINENNSPIIYQCIDSNGYRQYIERRHFKQT